MWIIQMNFKKLVMIILLISIPLLVLSLHLISESVYFGITEREFFGIVVSLNLIYDLVLYLIILNSIICIILSLKI